MTAVRTQAMPTAAASLADVLAAVHDLGIRMDSRFEKVETRLEAVETRLGAVETRLEKVETRQTKLEIDIAEARGHLKALPNLWQIVGSVIAVNGSIIAIAALALTLFRSILFQH